MNEMSKSHNARLRAGDYEFIRGRILDVGCGPDKLQLPPPNEVVGWDLGDGDATLLEGIPNRSFDCVVSAHCLEHLDDPETALRNWARVIRDGGSIYILVPLYSCYEKWNDFKHGVDPQGKFNPDHRTSWDVLNLEQAPKRHRHFGYKEIRQLGKQAGLTLVDFRTELDGYQWNRFDDAEFDQTTNGALAQLCVVFSKL
jgi:SAM-dependent methyltransferase